MLEIRHLKVWFDVREGFAKSRPLRAVDGVDLELSAGEEIGRAHV